MQSCLITANQTEITPDILGKITGVNSKHIIKGINWLVVEALPEKSIGIEEIRQASAWLNTSQIGSVHRILEINNADRLTNEAQNSLLKILEEPGVNNQVILVSQYPDRLLPTVLSRCRTFSLNNDHRSTVMLTGSDNELIVLLVKINPADAWLTIEKNGLVKDRGQIKKLLLDFIYFFNRDRDMVNLPFLSQSDRSKIIRSASKSLEMLEANTNPRLVIETFLLDLPRSH